jgi:CDP-diglyceride synthetase
VAEPLDPFGHQADEDPGDGRVEEEPPIYRSGQVRIIGAEPAGDAVHEATGPVLESHPELPHWNDPPTGQVPAILDRGLDEPVMAPPTWREEETDWQAHEESFEPAMLSEDLPGAGALDSEARHRVDVEREPWRFEEQLSDQTEAVSRPLWESPIEPDPDPIDVTQTISLADIDARGAHRGPASRDDDVPPPGSGAGTGTGLTSPGGVVSHRRVAGRSGSRQARALEREAIEAEAADGVAAAYEPDFAPAQEPEEPHDREPAGTGSRRRIVTRNRSALDDASAVAASRLSPPEPPVDTPRPPRVPRTSRVAAGARNQNTGNNGGTSGRNMRVAIGSGIILGGAGLACAAAGTVASMVIITLVVVLAAAEAFAAFRKAQYHPATLLGLVAVVSLMFETYNKGVSALPLILVLLVGGCFIWYLAKVEPNADPVAGLVATVFIFGWVGGFGSFAALLLDPKLFPHRHGIAFLLAAIIVTVAADVTGLLVGSAMGRHPLAPSISPNKSWEGLIGGAVAAVLSAVIIVHFIHPWTVSKSLVLGVVIAIVAPLGDLSQSMVKRYLGIKDMGRILPGHGGFLDRVDGLLFALPATYFVVKALHLG